MLRKSKKVIKKIYWETITGKKKEEVGGGKGGNRFCISPVELQNLLCVSDVYWTNFFISQLRFI